MSRKTKHPPVLCDDAETGIGTDFVMIAACIVVSAAALIYLLLI